MSVDGVVAPARRRGRPPRSDLPETRRKQIVRAAYAVLVDKGYDRTSIADIARAAQVGHGTVYRYFADKRDLLDHVFDYAVAKTVAALDLNGFTQEDVGDFEQSLELIEVFGWRLFGLVDTDPGILKLITVESSAIDPELRYRVVGMLSALDAAMGLLFDTASPAWAQTADPRVSATFGHVMLAMVGPGLVMSLTGDLDATHRQRCLDTISAIANRGLLSSVGSDRPVLGPLATQHELVAPSVSASEDVASTPTGVVRRRSELYAAAWSLFLERGYRDVDVSDITARASVSQGTFYNYFTSKRAVLDLIVAEVHDGLIEVVSGAPDPVEASDQAAFVAALHGLLTRVIGFIARQGPKMSFVALTAPGVDQQAFTTAVSGFVRLGDRVAAMLHRARGRGWIREDVDLHVAGQAVACCVVAAVLPALLDEAHAVDVDVSAQVCSYYLLGGMRAAAQVAPPVS